MTDQPTRRPILRHSDIRENLRQRQEKADITFLLRQPQFLRWMARQIDEAAVYAPTYPHPLTAPDDIGMGLSAIAAAGQAHLSLEWREGRRSQALAMVQDLSRVERRALAILTSAGVELAISFAPPEPGETDDRSDEHDRYDDPGSGDAG